MFFFKSYVASYGYVRRPGTDRIPKGVPKKFLRNRNRDSCEKSATGEENTGILRIPTGITNLALEQALEKGCRSSDQMAYLIDNLRSLKLSPKKTRIREAYA